MLDKRTRGGVWLAVVLLENLVFVAYLSRYTQTSPDRFLFGFPESFVVLVAFVFLVTGGNVALGWYYLGKPDVSRIYSSGRKDAPEPSATSAPSEVEGS